MKLLLLGRDGNVGRSLQRTLAPLGEVVALGRSELDITDRAAVDRAIGGGGYDIVVNAAAYTAVDAAETDWHRAWAVNAKALEFIGTAAAASGALVLHYSTDYVFGGSGAGFQGEDDPVNPLSRYGASKQAGEVMLRESGARHVILRTSWVYAEQGKNFPLTILRLARERDTLDVVADQVGAPTSADLIADVSARVAARPVPGTFHLAASGEVSWHGLARFLVAEALALGAPLRLRPEAIAPIPATAYPAPAPRPLNSRLDTTRLRTTYGLTLPPWQDGIRHLLSTLRKENRL